MRFLLIPFLMILLFNCKEQINEDDCTIDPKTKLILTNHNWMKTPFKIKAEVIAKHIFMIRNDCAFPVNNIELTIDYFSQNNIFISKEIRNIKETIPAKTTKNFKISSAVNDATFKSVIIVTHADIQRR